MVTKTYWFILFWKKHEFKIVVFASIILIFILWLMSDPNQKGHTQRHIIMFLHQLIQKNKLTIIHHNQKEKQNVVELWRIYSNDHFQI